MKPPVITPKHVRIFWISVAICLVFIVVLYPIGKWMPSPFIGEQAKSCEGARQALADLQNPQGRSAVDLGKIRDAEQLVKIECAKAE